MHYEVVYEFILGCNKPRSECYCSVSVYELPAYALLCFGYWTDGSNVNAFVLASNFTKPARDSVYCVKPLPWSSGSTPNQDHRTLSRQDLR